MKTGRPTVRLTVARMVDGSRLSPIQRIYLDRVLFSHDRPNLDHLIYACLQCGSIGEIASKSQRERDLNIRALGREAYACCGPTVIFQTEKV